MNKRILLLSSLAGAAAVILGAFGAHALKAVLSQQALKNWETAVHYQFVHALALLALSLMPSNTQTKTASWCFGIGILAFSGSLYLLSLRDVLHLPLAFIGPVTPFGGLFFIAGWISLFLYALKKN